jgi:hypothetical protein
MPSTISAGTTAGTAIAVAGDTTGNLAFQTNGTTTAMTITTAQNVGIGTTNPTNFGSATTLTVNNAGDGVVNTQSNGVDGLRIGSGSTSSYLFEARNLPMRFLTNATEQMRINAAGQVTTPNQPMFSAFRDAGSVTGNTTPVAVVFNKATLANVGSHYSTGTGRFTAPIAGTYYFSVSGMMDSSPNSTGDQQLIIRRNGTSNISTSNPPSSTSGIQGMGFAATGAVSLAANDYVEVVFYASNNASRFYAGGGEFNNFSGFLIG